MPKLRKKLLTLPVEVYGAFGSITTNVDRDTYIKALRDAGWTLESIGQAADMSRERVRQIVLSTPLHNTELPVPPVPEMPERRRPEYIEPSPTSLARLLELQPLAQQVRSNSPKFRKEAEEYTALLNYVHVEEGVTLYRLAKRLGVTHGALRFRLARYGYKTPANGSSKVYSPIHQQNRHVE